MADEQSVAAFGTTITEADVREFVQARVRHPVCPFCESDAWDIALQPPADDHAVVIGTAKLEASGQVDLQGKHAIIVALFICTRCGFVRQHAIYPVASWKGRKGLLG